MYPTHGRPPEEPTAHERELASLRSQLAEAREQVRKHEADAARKEQAHIQTIDARDRVAEMIRFEGWWLSDGLYIHPDIEEVDWYDKRHKLAEVAFTAGYKKAMELRTGGRS